MRRLKLAIPMLAVLVCTTASSIADNRPQQVSNAIRLEGQIREITGTDDVTIRLHRDRYPIYAWCGATHVHWLDDGRRALLRELEVGDSIRVEGTVEKDVIVATEITILLRIEHRGAH
jgi:hypothetical protein